MTLTKDKRTGIYRARYKSATGKPKSITTKQTTRTEAKKVVKHAKLEELEQAARAGLMTQEVIARITSDKRVTLATAIDHYAQWMAVVGRAPTYIHNSKAVLLHFATQKDIGWEPLLSKPLSAITERILHQFINAPGDRKASWRSIQLINLNQFFEFCAAKGWVLGNPAALVRVRLDKLTHAQKEKRPRNPFTDEEIRTLLEVTKPEPHASAFWHAAIALGRYTGLRLGDIATLEWDTLSIPNNTITVWTDKRDARVQLPIEPKALVDAIATIERFNAKYCFPDERAMMQDPSRRANLSTYFRRICERAGIHGKTFHGLRHAYADACDRAGIPMPHIAKNMGHSSTTTTAGYLTKQKDG